MDINKNMNSSLLMTLTDNIANRKRDARDLLQRYLLPFTTKRERRFTSSIPQMRL